MTSSFLNTWQVCFVWIDLYLVFKGIKFAVRWVSHRLIVCCSCGAKGLSETIDMLMCWQQLAILMTVHVSSISVSSGDPPHVFDLNVLVIDRALNLMSALTSCDCWFVPRWHKTCSLMSFNIQTKYVTVLLLINDSAIGIIAGRSPAGSGCHM